MNFIHLLTVVLCAISISLIKFLILAKLTKVSTKSELEEFKKEIRAEISVLMFVIREQKKY